MGTEHDRREGESPTANKDCPPIGPKFKSEIPSKIIRQQPLGRDEVESPTGAQKEYWNQKGGVACSLQL